MILHQQVAEAARAIFPGERNHRRKDGLTD
jgi:hypothetical protein